jgi:hypothetical protein
LLSSSASGLNYWVKDTPGKLVHGTRGKPLEGKLRDHFVVELRYEVIPYDQRVQMDDASHDISDNAMGIRIQVHGQLVVRQVSFQALVENFAFPFSIRTQRKWSTHVQRQAELFVNKMQDQSSFSSASTL